jgi:hypothetical protein
MVSEWIFHQFTDFFHSFYCYILFVHYYGFHYDIFIHVCNVLWVYSSPLLVSLAPPSSSSSHGGSFAMCPWLFFVNPWNPSE